MLYYYGDFVEMLGEVCLKLRPDKPICPARRMYATGNAPACGTTWFQKAGRLRGKENCREGEIISKTDLRKVQNHQTQRQYQSNL